ncbi:MAG: cation:proton antiporter [Elusimicrobia bacterium]|nr:cation:proton antiporter [Elusimicrobiota bacterium]
MDIIFTFFIAGLVIFIGFLGGLVFEKTKISEILVLIFIGIILGPVLKLIAPEKLAAFTEIFGALALMVILFDGGMALELEKVFKTFSFAAIFVSITFIGTTVAIALFSHIYLACPLIEAFILGSVLGCTSGAIVMPIVCRMSISEETKSILSIESVLSDVWAIVVVISLIKFASIKEPDALSSFKNLASAFSVATVIGVIVGFIWLKILKTMKDKPFSYMITLAAVLCIYSITEFFGGSGPISSLVFGLVLGNEEKIAPFFKIKKSELLGEKIKWFHNEFTFFIRTFFFVYIGMIFSLRDLTSFFLLNTLGLILIIFLVRYICTCFMVSIYKERRSERHIISAMAPRGLTSAVLATMPIASGFVLTTQFADQTSIVIIITNIVVTAGVFIIEKRKLKQKKMVDGIRADDDDDSTCVQHGGKNV